MVVVTLSTSIGVVNLILPRREGDPLEGPLPASLFLKRLRLTGQFLHGHRARLQSGEPADVVRLEGRPRCKSAPPSEARSRVVCAHARPGVKVDVLALLADPGNMAPGPTSVRLTPIRLSGRTHVIGSLSSPCLFSAVLAHSSTTSLSDPESFGPNRPGTGPSPHPGPIPRRPNRRGSACALPGSGSRRAMPQRAVSGSGKGPAYWCQ